MYPLAFCLSYIAPISIVVGYMLGGIYTFLTPVITFTILPVLDLIFGEDKSNHSERETLLLKEHRTFRFILYIYSVAHFAILIWGAYVVTHVPLTTLELVGFTFSMGVMTGGIGITAAHELCHRSNTLERFLAKALLMSVCYMHFVIEHVRGHHVHVGTSKDPASASLGQSLYAFYPQTLIGSFLSAWKLENTRLKKAKLPMWSFHNQMLWFIFLPMAFMFSLVLVFGWKVAPYFLVQSAIAILLLETVNYLEHYGLERKETEPGKYEKVSISHSWNSDHIVTNYFLFRLQRHADHHAYPRRRYQILRSMEKSPQLPTGYPGMILLTLFPPLWRKVMDHRAIAALEKQKINSENYSVEN